jgi:hypothetical protein
VFARNQEREDSPGAGVGEFFTLCGLGAVVHILDSEEK